MSYIWELFACHNDFFNGKWKVYEDSNYYSSDEILEIKDAYVKGNTALFREIEKLLNGNREPLWIQVHHNDETCHIYPGAGRSIIVQQYSYTVDNIEEITGMAPDNEYTFADVSTIEEIREVVDYVTNAHEYIPINTVSLIKKGEEVVYTGFYKI